VSQEINEFQRKSAGNLHECKTEIVTAEEDYSACQKISEVDEERYYLEVDGDYTDVNKSSDISCAGFLRALGPASSQFTESSKKNVFRPVES
jgi:hypothetical protein